MLLTTRRPINLSLAWFEHFAQPALGLAGPGLMTPSPVKAENTAIRCGDVHGPLVGRLAGEDLATGQASLIIRFIVGTMAVWVPAHTGHVALMLFDVLRALGSFVTWLLAAVTPLAGVWLF